MASRRSCRILYANIRGLHKNLSDLFLAASGRDVFFFILRLFSSRSHISELLVSGFVDSAEE